MTTIGVPVGLSCVGLLFGLSAGPAQATFSGANGRVAYTWSRGGEGFETGPNPRLVGVVSVRADGSGRRLIARRARVPRYSPDGRRIAFWRSQRVWVARADGKRARPVTPGGWRAGEYDWSPGGSRLAFVRSSKTTVKAALYTIKPDGSGPRRLAVSIEGLRLYPGAWSPNGKAIVYEQYRINGTSLVRVHRSGQVTTHARGSIPSWSRRGLIAYMTRASQGSPNHVCVVRPEPGPPVHCFGSSDASATYPTWSPDGRRLAFTYSPYFQGPTELWTARPDGTVLTRTPSDAFPIFSPDGRLFALSVGRFGGNPRLGYMDLYTMRPDGSSRQRIVRGGQAAGPDWQPRRPR
jgi:Tol biopolymer transport system component